MAGAEYHILGTLEALRAGKRLALGGQKQRTVLALLLLNADRVVTTDALVEALWPEKAPGKPLTAIQGYVSSLRKTLDPDAPFDVIVTEPSGYRLPLTAGSLDLHVFESLLAAGKDALAHNRPQEARGALTSALALFRGAPLADFTYADWARVEIGRLEELRLVCLEERIEAGLALGEHAELVPELEALVAANPLRERPRGQLMIALYRGGRQSEALAAYQSARQVLVEEFGIEPSPALRELERAILLQDEALAAVPSVEEATSAASDARALLFTDIEGSTRLLRRLGDAYGPVLVEHRRLLQQSAEARGGRVVDNYGDGFFAVFASPRAAVEATVEALGALASYPWPDGAAVRVRTGLHSGRPVPVGTGFVGLDVHRVARICAASHGEQILASEEMILALGDDLPDGVEVRDLGTQSLPDMARPEQLFQLVVAGLRAEFPPLRTESQPASAERPDRSILVLGTTTQAPEATLEVAETLARSHVPHELIVARLMSADSVDRELSEAELAHAAAELFELRAALSARGVAARVAAFTTRAAGDDGARLAAEQAVDLLLVGREVDDLADGPFDDELEAVFAQAICDVALCVSPEGSKQEDGSVAVPFGGGEHEWAALELGAWLAGATGTALRLLGTAETTDGKRDASRLLASASLAVQQLVSVPTEPELLAPGAEAIVESAAGARFVVVGAPDDWRAYGLGSTRLSLARSARGSTTLFVRRGVRPGGLAPNASQTRFTWSIADVARTAST
jgi:DNA-binding SARP family transcriptional activator